MTCGSLFSGIGGIELGLEWSGLVTETKWQVEKDEYCRNVLARHWPGALRYGDIHDVGKHNLEPVELICGGFPCQPFSVAGKRRGKEDDRALWPEMVRVIAELRPALVVGENVPGFINMGLDQAIVDLEAIGYQLPRTISGERIVYSIPAVACDALHTRDRVWIVAYMEEIATMADTSKCGWGQGDENHERPSQGEGAEKKRGGFAYSRENASHADCPECKEQRSAVTDMPEHTAAECGCRWLPEPDVGRVAHGVPYRVDRLKALGNAVVPQVACAIGTIIREWYVSVA